MPAPQNKKAEPWRTTSSPAQARPIEVLEGLEPVRKRPGMYIGGTDERALHHLVAEILDNAMDEAVAGHANRIEVELHADGFPHRPRQRPRHPGRPASEVPRQVGAGGHPVHVLHSGGKFSGKAYETSGGLHGVGVSVVNALSDRLEVEVARNKELYEQSFSRGMPLGPIQKLGAPRTGAAPPSPSTPTRRSSARAPSSPRASSRWRGPRPICSRGVEIRWKSEIIPMATRRHGGHLPLPRRPGRLPGRHAGKQETYADRPFFASASRRNRASPVRSNGRSTGRPAQRRLHPVLLQHRAHPRGRHA
jgi:topoisomerase-4 subunit B